jgi:glycosyltransferase 2 family protein
LRYWGLAVGVYVLAQLVSSVRWQLLAAPLGFQKTTRQYVSFYFIGMFFNLLLPTSVGGDVVRALYLAGGRHDPSCPAEPPRRRGEAMLSVFADRASGLMVLVVMACLAGLLAPTALPNWMIAILGLLAACVVVGLTALPALPMLGRLPVLGPRLARLVDAGRVYLNRPGLLLTTTGLSIAVQLASVAILWLITEGLGLGLSFTYLAVVVPLVTLLTLIPVSVNGMGLREVGMVVLLAPVGVAGAAAVTLSLLWFAVAAGVSLIGGGLYLLDRHPGVAEGKSEVRVEGQFDVELVRGSSDQGRMRQPPAAA